MQSTGQQAGLANEPQRPCHTRSFPSLLNGHNVRILIRVWSGGALAWRRVNEWCQVEKKREPVEPASADTAKCPLELVLSFNESEILRRHAEPPRDLSKWPKNCTVSFFKLRHVRSNGDWLAVVNNANLSSYCHAEGSLVATKLRGFTPDQAGE